MSAQWSLTGGKRTSRLRALTSENNADLTVKRLSRLDASVPVVGSRISQEARSTTWAQSAICSNTALASSRTGVSNPSVNQR